MRTSMKVYIVSLVALVTLFFSCGNEKTSTKVPLKTTYLNHADSATYVGMNTCKQCHSAIYETFKNTGMCKSFGIASKLKSSATFSNANIFDSYSNFNYHAEFFGDSMFITESRKQGAEEIHKRTEQVNYIVGSGQHTNSHLQIVNGYVNQMPMTFYTQRKKWDLPPGFENGLNTRFSRKIGLECMSCHNAYPAFVAGSENKYTQVPQGIDCERCHGPGSIHVQQRMHNSPIDTSVAIDYSIVNPAKLSLDRQFDICMRCHLQGNTVLKEGKSFFDFKPGQVLSDYMSTFLPRYENTDDEFIMASHADRLKQSACFIKSLQKAKNQNSLKPYKEALTCITCHNPHISVRETNPNVFNDACNNCHTSEQTERIHKAATIKKFDDCVACHMPLSGSIDIPHVSVHDHYIRKPISSAQKTALKKFIGLASVNEKNPTAYTKAMAYILQYERFEQKKYYLDSAQVLLQTLPTSIAKLQAQVQLFYSAQQPKQVLDVLNQYGANKAFVELDKTSLDNKQAWTAYRIAETFLNFNDIKHAFVWIELACKLAPYQLDFRNKKATLLAQQNRVEEAIKEFEFVLSEHPKNMQAMVNLGYLSMLQGKVNEAASLYAKAYALDPDYESLLLNYAGYWLYVGNNAEAEKLLKHCLSKHPQNPKAKLILAQIKKSHA